MIDKAPIGYLSPAHLSEGDRALANRYAKTGEFASFANIDSNIGFYFLALDLAVQMENIDDREELLDDLHLLEKVGFSDNFCSIIYDAFRQGLQYVLFHEYGPEDSSYEILSGESHVFDH